MKTLNEIIDSYPPPRTDWQQEQMVKELKEFRLNEFLNEQNKIDCSEYSEKIWYIKTIFKGNFIVNENAYHPQLFVGTKKEHDFLTFKYYSGREDEFKIIDIEYLTEEEYKNKYPLENCK